MSSLNVEVSEYSLVTQVNINMKVNGGTQGDILVDNGTDVEFASVGIDGDVLRADSSQNAGLKFGNLPVTGGNDVLTTPTAGVRISGSNVVYSIFNPAILSLGISSNSDYLYLPYNVDIYRIDMEVSRGTNWPSNFGNPRYYLCDLGYMDTVTGNFVSFGANATFTIGSAIDPGVGNEHFDRKDIPNTVRFPSNTTTYGIIATATAGTFITLRVSPSYSGINLTIAVFIWLKGNYL